MILAVELLTSLCPIYTPEYFLKVPLRDVPGEVAQELAKK